MQTMKSGYGVTGGDSCPRDHEFKSQQDWIRLRIFKVICVRQIVHLFDETKTKKWLW